MAVKGQHRAGLLPLLAVAGHSVGPATRWRGGGVRPPGSVQPHQRLLQAGTALAALWLCVWLVLPLRSIEQTVPQHAQHQRALGVQQAVRQQQTQQAQEQQQVATAAGAEAVRPEDPGEAALAARHRFLLQQQAVRHDLARQRAALAQRPHEGFLAQAPPKVALLFLVRGNMPLEPVWRTFFETAAQIEPVALPPAFANDWNHRHQQQQQANPLKRQQGRQHQQVRQPVKHQTVQGQKQHDGRDQQYKQHRHLVAASDILLGEPSSGEGSLHQEAEKTLREEQGFAQAATHGVDPREGVGMAGSADQAAQQAQRDADLNLRATQQDWQRLQVTPVTPQQQKQLEANQKLEAALGAGEQVQEAQQQAQRARSMEAPLSILSPLDTEGIIARQDLFSVYVHSMPGYYYKNISIFSGYQIDRRVFVSWGQYTVAEAERRLLITALVDPRNQRFVLLSETCTPLYPPHVLYLQLLSDTKSRLNACAQQDALVDRWNAALYIPGVLTPQKWRKSAQWKALLRSHAQVVATDRQLAPRFERECYSFFPPIMVRPPYVIAQNRTWVQRSCISDEHYIPTLLAVHGKDSETTCADAMTVADWMEGVWSPKVHHKEDVNPDLLLRLRKQRATETDCNAREAVSSAATMFRRRGSSLTLAGQPLPGSHSSGRGNRAERMLHLLRHRRLTAEVETQPHIGQQQQGQQQRHTYVSMSDACFLMARKFAPDTVPALQELGEDCPFGTAISSSCLPV